MCRPYVLLAGMMQALVWALAAVLFRMQAMAREGHAQLPCPLFAVVVVRAAAATVAACMVLANSWPAKGADLASAASAILLLLLVAGMATKAMHEPRAEPESSLHDPLLGLPLRPGTTKVLTSMY